MIFLSSQTSVDKEMCVTIAKQLDIPAQVGDCLAAVETINPSCLGAKSIRNEDNKSEVNKQIDRRNCAVNWATAFGLSLS